MNEDRFNDYVDELKLMIHYYNHSQPATAEKLCDELKESLDDLMRGTY